MPLPTETEESPKETLQSAESQQSLPTKNKESLISGKVRGYIDKK
jgi:hypothetical protein